MMADDLLNGVFIGWWLGMLIQDAMAAFVAMVARRRRFELYKNFVLSSWVPQEIRVDVDEQGYWIK